MSLYTIREQKVYRGGVYTLETKGKAALKTHKRGKKKRNGEREKGHCVGEQRFPHVNSRVADTRLTASRGPDIKKKKKEKDFRNLTGSGREGRAPPPPRKWKVFRSFLPSSRVREKLVRGLHTAQDILCCL